MQFKKSWALQVAGDLASDVEKDHLIATEVAKLGAEQKRLFAAIEEQLGELTKTLSTATSSLYDISNQRQAISERPGKWRM